MVNQKWIKSLNFRQNKNDRLLNEYKTKSLIKKAFKTVFAELSSSAGKCFQMIINPFICVEPLYDTGRIRLMLYLCMNNFTCRLRATPYEMHHWIWKQTQLWTILCNIFSELYLQTWSGWKIPDLREKYLDLASKDRIKLMCAVMGEKYV